MSQMTRRARRGGAIVLLATAGGAYTAQSDGISNAKSTPAAAAVCGGCHGANGEGMPAANIPRLAGQWADYLDKQLRDYASGVRENPVMQNFAKPLTDQDRAAVATYYASLTAPYAPQSLGGDAAQAAHGHQIAHQGLEAKRVQACDNCHGPDGSGVQHSAPYLAGQSAAYLASTLHAWQQGTRKNDSGKLMASVAGQLDDADITAVAAYFAHAADGPEGQPQRTLLEHHDQAGVPGKEIVIGTALLPPGTVIGFHVHPGDESGYVLKGTLILKTQGKPDRTLQVGDSFFNPRGAIHSLVAGPGGEGGMAISTWIVDKGKPLAIPVP